MPDLHDHLGDVADNAIFGLYLAVLTDQGPHIGVEVTVPDRFRHLVEDVAP